MQRLEYHVCETSDFTTFEKHFPGLNILTSYTQSMMIYVCIRKIQWETEKWISAIQSNPQLQSLTVPFLGTSMLFQIINDTLPFLQDLTLNVSFGFHLRNINNQSAVYHFKSVRKLKNHYLEPCQFNAIPFSFSKLEEVTLKFNHLYMLEYHDEHFYNFIHENPSITILKITAEQKINLPRLTAINMLPLVWEVDLGHSKVSVDEAVGFMNKKKLLKKFSFDVPNSRIPDIHARNISNQWRGFATEKYEWLKQRIGPYVFSRP